MTIRSTSLRQNPAYRPENSRPFLWWLLVVAAGGACRAHIPEQVMTPVRPLPPRIEEVPRSWTPRPGTLSRDYVLEQRARVVTTTDSTTLEDSTSLAVAAAVRHVAGSGVAGLLREVSVGAPGAPEAPLPGLSLPYAFTAADVPPGAQYAFTGRPVATDPCAVPSHVALVSLRDVLFRVPDSLYVGLEWADSGSVTGCRDGVRLEFSTNRRFRLTGYEPRGGAGVLLVSRTVTATLRGVTIRGEDTTRVEGAGLGTMQYELDAATAAVLSAFGSGSVEIVVRNAVHAQRARQTTTIRILEQVAPPR